MEGLPIYDGIDLPVSLIRRNNQGIKKNRPNIPVPKREANSNLSLYGKLQPQNVNSSMLVTPSGITTLRKEVQPSNALPPILVTPSGITTLLKEVQP